MKGGLFSKLSLPPPSLVSPFLKPSSPLPLPLLLPLGPLEPQMSGADAAPDVVKRVSGLMSGLFGATEGEGGQLKRQIDEDEESAASETAEEGSKEREGQAVDKSSASQTDSAAKAAAGPGHAGDDGPAQSEPHPHAPQLEYARPRTQAHSQRVPFPANAHYQTATSGALRSSNKLALPMKGGGSRPGTTGGGSRSSASSVVSRGQNTSSGRTGFDLRAYTPNPSPLRDCECLSRSPLPSHAPSHTRALAHQAGGGGGISCGG